MGDAVWALMLRDASKYNLLTHLELQRLLLLFYMQFIAKQVTITRYPLKGGMR